MPDRDDDQAPSYAGGGEVGLPGFGPILLGQALHLGRGDRVELPQVPQRLLSVAQDLWRGLVLWDVDAHGVTGCTWLLRCPLILERRQRAADLLNGHAAIGIGSQRLGDSLSSLAIHLNA